MPSIAAAADPLPSWNDSPRKQAILDFVTDVTTADGEHFVPAAEADQHMHVHRHEGLEPGRDVHSQPRVEPRVTLVLREAKAVEVAVRAAADEHQVGALNVGLSYVNMNRTTSRLDIGQTVVLKQGTILAVEAFEGTDRTIRRAAPLRG